VPTAKRQRKKEGRQARLEAARAEARRKQRQRRLITAVISAAVIVAVLALVARGAGDDKSTADGGTTTTTAAVTTTSTTVAIPAGLTKPVIEPKKGPAPSKLVSNDITPGTGAEAKAGDTVTIHYVGVLYDGGKQFDSSWDKGAPATFDLDGLIKGWQQGIPGMKVGGRRELIVPPDLGYGAVANGDIPPNSTLVFVIDLLGVG
jgi:FKBP-type peptidyl-prolyl cis-trans isomerase